MFCLLLDDTSFPPHFLPLILSFCCEAAAKQQQCPTDGALLFGRIIRECNWMRSEEGRTSWSGRQFISNGAFISHSFRTRMIAILFCDGVVGRIENEIGSLGTQNCRASSLWLAFWKRNWHLGGRREKTDWIFNGLAEKRPVNKSSRVKMDSFAIHEHNTSTLKFCPRVWEGTCAPT